MSRIEFHTVDSLPFGQPAVLLVDAEGGVDVLVDYDRLAELDLSEEERMTMLTRLFHARQAPPSSQMQVQRGMRDRRGADRRARPALALVV